MNNYEGFEQSSENGSDPDLSNCQTILGPNGWISFCPGGSADDSHQEALPKGEPTVFVLPEHMQAQQRNEGENMLGCAFIFGSALLLIAMILDWKKRHPGQSIFPPIN